MSYSPDRFTVTAEFIDHGKGYWQTQHVSVHDAETDAVVGEYDYSYSHGLPWYAFQQDGKWFALFSSNYTATSVMSLPDCQIIATEEPSAGGFCPVEFYVPDEYDQGGSTNGQFGLVCGCVWGDDSGGWKVEYLDLSQIQQGKIARKQRFGYFEMADEHLEDSVLFVMPGPMFRLAGRTYEDFPKEIPHAQGL